MKKILSLALAGIISSSLVMTASAFEEGTTTPTVCVNNMEIEFKDQQAIIDKSANRTLIPLRGVFEAMGASVIWNNDTRTVIIDSKDNLTRIMLTIGNPEMTVMKAISLVKYESETETLETAPIILNNRTMIPLRAVVEAMKGEVNWDNDTKTAYIFSKEYNKFIEEKTQEFGTFDFKDHLLTLSLSADKDEVEAGDEVNVYVNISNAELYPESILTGVEAAISYERDKFKYEKTEVISNGKAIKSSIEAHNPDFSDTLVKSVMLLIPGDEYWDLAETTVKFTFTALTGEEGSFSLSNRKNTRGYDTLLLVDKDNETKILQDYSQLYIDQTPVTVK